jgi:hypothetical protein
LFLNIYKNQKNPNINGESLSYALFISAIM